MKKVESKVNRGLKAFILSKNWLWELKNAKAIIWLPINGEPAPVSLLVKEGGDIIFVRVNNREDFFFRTRKVKVYELDGVILIMETAIAERVNDEKVEVELVDEEASSQEEANHKASFSPWELLKGLNIQMPQTGGGAV